MKEKSLLIDHPLIQGYLRKHNIKTLNENTKFPLRLLAAVYQDYTGTKIVAKRQRNDKVTKDQMVTFSQFFSPDL